MIARIGTTRTLLVALLAASLSGCGLLPRRREAPVPLRSAQRDSLIAADIGRAESAARRGLSGAARSWLEPGIVYLRAGAPIIYGAEGALSAVVAGMPETATYRWQPLGGEVSRDGKSGYTFGIAAVGIPTGGSTPLVRLDRYLAFWRRSADGVWRVAAYSEVGSLPVPGETQPATSELAPTLALPRGRRAEAAQQVREADSAFSLAADLQGTGVAFSAFVAPQGVVFAGTELVVGTDAVKAFYDDQQRAGGALNWRPVFADAAESGDLGMTVGEYVFTGHGPTGAIVQRFGKYLTIWKRQPGGEWRFVVDGGSGSPTPGGR